MKKIIGQVKIGSGLLIVLFQIATAQWVQTNGPMEGVVSALAVKGSNLFAGTGGGGVWYRPISQMGVINPGTHSSRLPRNDFEISTPGRGNPIATVSFTLPHSDHVAITVYDLSGHAVASPVDRNLDPGLPQLRLEYPEPGARALYGAAQDGIGCLCQKHVDCPVGWINIFLDGQAGF
jgi:hypothetical protein